MYNDTICVATIWQTNHFNISRKIINQQQLKYIFVLIFTFTFYGLYLLTLFLFTTTINIFTFTFYGLYFIILLIALRHHRALSESTDLSYPIFVFHLKRSHAIF